MPSGCQNKSVGRFSQYYPTLSPGTEIEIKNTVYKWISEKGMPAHKIGHLWKFKKDQANKWVENGERYLTRQMKNKIKT